MKKKTLKQHKSFMKSVAYQVQLITLWLYGRVIDRNIDLVS